MTSIRLIVVPYELGRLRDGVGCGPEHLLERGAEGALRSEGADVSTEVVLLPERTSNEIDDCFELVRAVSVQVRGALETGQFPVILSGSCCHAALGTMTGMAAEPSPAIIWFDAHGDFNSPDTSDSGYFDGMGLSVLTGSAWQGMHATIDGVVIPETSAILAGARAYDVPERRRVESSELNVLSPEAIRSPGSVSSALTALSPAPSGLYLHLDLDVLDGEQVPVNIYSAPDGVSPDQLRSCVGEVLDSAPLAAFSLTAYHPACDHEDRVPPIAVSLLETVAAHIAGAAR